MLYNTNSEAINYISVSGKSLDLLVKYDVLLATNKLAYLSAVLYN